MKKKSITFLLFGPVLCPGGGMKIILEYANRLVKDGHDVTIAYPATLNWKKRDLTYKLKSIYHYFLHEIKGWKCNRWFKLDPRVKEVHTISLNYRDIPKSDIYIATEARTAPYVASYPVDKSRKFYFIQGYENWVMSDREVRSTYHLELNKITIADWLKKIISEEENQDCTVVKNSFDFEYFQATIPIEQRNPLVLGTLYNTAELKDFKTTYKAIEIVHDRYPSVTVLVFGTTERPEHLPEYYKYYQSPNKVRHNEIYNEAAIFIGSSKLEGWGLTIGEAMICGASVACTDIPGYREMSIPEETALVSPIEDYEALAENIIRLIENDQLRYSIAKTGNKFIQQFKWENAFPKFKKALRLND